MKLKDIMVVTVLSLALFPIILIITMYATGFMQVKFGWIKQAAEEAKQTVETVRYTPYQESLAVLHSKSFEAFEAQRAEIGHREKKLTEDEERLKELQKDITRRNEDLMVTKARLEALVAQSNELELRRIKQLAQVYGSMRAEEAAPILFTLKDSLIVKIMENVSDTRQKAKLMGAMGNLSKERAGTISKLMAQAKIPQAKSKAKPQEKNTAKPEVKPKTESKPAQAQPSADKK
jgi:flagellar motility protein MotE (MotC chaperone)